MKWRSLAATGLAMAMAATPATAQTEMITNGGFETCDLTGWTPWVWSGSSGGFAAAFGGITPISGLPAVGPASGSTCYALTDMSGPGAYALTQSFTTSGAASSAILQFQMSLTDWSGAGPIFGPGFDPFSGANQWASVDLFFGGLTDGFTTASPLQNFFAGTMVNTSVANPYVLYSFDITSLLNTAGTYTLRFAEVDNQLFHNMAIDDVSLTFSAVPEPATLGLLAIGLVGLSGAGVLRRRRQRG